MMPAVPGTDSRMSAAMVLGPRATIGLLEVGQRTLALLRLVVAWKCERYEVRPRRSARRRSVPWSLGQRRGSPVTLTARCGAAVVAAVGRRAPCAAGVQAGHPDRVLVRLGAAVGEEHPVQVAGVQLGDQAGGLGARVVGVLRGDRAELCRLLLDRRDDLRVLVADVGVDQLRGEVQAACCPSPSQT